MFFDFSYFGYLAFAVMAIIIPVCVQRFGREHGTKAAMFCMVVPFLFGPNVCVFDLPSLPGFRKEDLAAIGALIGATMYCRGRLARARPFRGIDILFLLIVAGTLGTVAVNGEAVQLGTELAPPYTLYEAMQSTVSTLLAYWVPYVVGRAFVRSRAEAVLALRYVVAVVVIQVPLLLFELRFSPNLHEWTYGYDVIREFAQSIRGGGYRPKIYSGHGLVLGMFTMTATIAAFALRKTGTKRLLNLPIGVVAWGLVVICALVKSQGPFSYTLVGIALLSYASPKWQFRAAIVLASMVYFYAYIHISGQFPRDEILAELEVYGEDRVQSMEFRFDNELLLVERAAEKQWFGWGGFGRERVFSPEGKDLTVQDGHWVIMLGQMGAYGMTVFFSMFLVPIIITAFRLPRVQSIADQRLLATFAILTGWFSFNMIPNQLIPHLPFFCAGAMLGMSEEVMQAQRQARKRRASQAEMVAPANEAAMPSAG